MHDLRKWGLIGIVIGVAAGLGALALIHVVDFVGHVLLGGIVGYTPPLAAGEGGGAGYAFHVASPWLLPVVTGLSGLAGGLLVWRYAPGTAGIGTNAAIATFHENGRIPFKDALVKLVGSALTIGSGMTSGREGPIAQIGASAGTTLADRFHLTARERNIALAAGLGAGIAAMFKAPLAGAIISAEVFYREDFEAEALIPGLIASVVGYAIVGSATGFGPVFAMDLTSGHFQQPLTLVLYALLGVACALLARSFVRLFFPVQRFFRRFPLFVATGIGGFLTGALGLGLISLGFMPTMVGTGYGWLQLAIFKEYALLPPLLLGGAILAELIGATLTLGSGNSGGVFGPSVVTGGMLGAVFGHYAEVLLPALALDPANFAIVGMVAFFAAVAKAPVSTIVMIAEMTGGYGLLGPSMFAVVTAFLLSGPASIFPAQVRTRLDSPFHADTFEPVVLRRTRVREVMRREPVTVSPDVLVSRALRVMSTRGVGGLPVIEGARLAGIVTRSDLLRVPEEEREHVTVAHVTSRNLVRAHPNEDLYRVLERFISRDIGHLPVTPRDAPHHLVGLVTRGHIGRAIKDGHVDGIPSASDAPEPVSGGTVRPRSR